MTTVGLLGFGLAGRQLHLPLILASGLRVGAVVTRQTDAVRAVLPEARVYAAAEALLADQNIDLVVITTPNQLHAPQALAALRAGKHVVIDKPFALTLAEADAVIACAQQHDRRLAIFHNRRWDSDFLTLQKLLRSQRLGEINTFRMRWDRYRPQLTQRWREQAAPGSGVLYDLGPHLIDQALCLFGPPEWIQAETFTQRSGASVEDAFEIRMGRGPLRIELGAASLVADHCPRYELHGALASLRKDGLDVQESQLRAGHSPLDAGFGIEPPSQFARLVTGSDGAAEILPSERGCWPEFYRLLRAAIEAHGPVPVAGEDARHVMVVLDAALRSHREQRRIALDA